MQPENWMLYYMDIPRQAAAINYSPERCLLKANYPNVKTVALTMPDDVPSLFRAAVQKMVQDAVFRSGSIIGYNNSATDFSPYAQNHGNRAMPVLPVPVSLHPTHILKNTDAGSNIFCSLQQRNSKRLY